MSDHLVNSWENILMSSVDGDPIVALTWLHNGVKLALHVEMVRLREHHQWLQHQEGVTSALLSSSALVWLYKLWGEVFTGQILPVFDVVWWEADGGLACRDGEWLGDRVPAETRRRSADGQRESVPTAGTRGLGRYRLHGRREHCGGSIRWQQLVPSPVLQGGSFP